MANALRFGVYCEIQNGLGCNEFKTIWDVFHLIEHADALGYDVFNLIEHHFFQRFSISANPLAMFAAAAQKTHHIRFRTLCHTLPLNNPVVKAGEIAEVDILTNGRLDVGVGRGHAWEYPPTGIPMQETQGRYDESLDILELAWVSDRFSYEGKYFHLKDISVVPKPIQKPYPPVYMVGTSGASFEKGAKKGWALAFGGPAPVSAFMPGVDRYREACAKYGTKPVVACIRAVYLAESERQAKIECEEALKKFFAYNSSAVSTVNPSRRQEMLDSGYGFYASGMLENLDKLSYEEIVDGGYALVGPPSKVLDQCAELKERYGVDEVSIISQYGNIELWKSAKTQELFAEKVIAQLR
jgi:alkanesulfonate monooxygenase SsuD/methylene tetrahydromethanopterin reductase-like flavin-dependent oxidoreductase (luciferase family)